MSQLLSPPSSPRDHRHYIPRRPSPLSLPPTAPHLSLAGSSSGYQPFALTEFAVTTPRSGSKMPRYPLEKQRRALKELEMEQERKRQSQQMERQQPMQVPRGHASSAGSPSPTTTLPLTPRSGTSSASSYSQPSDDDGKSRPKRGPAATLCTTLFGSCFGTLLFHRRR